MAFPNYQRLVLFNADNVFDVSTEGLTFFQPSFVHSYYPLTYIFSRVFYLFVNQPMITEFVLPMAITASLMYVVVSAALTRVDQEQHLVLYSVCLLAFLAVEFSQLGFESIAIWALIVLTETELGHSKRGREGNLVSMLLLVVIVLSNDGVITYMVMLYYGLSYAFSPTRRRESIQLLLFGGLSQLLYFSVIAFKGPSYYSTYLPTLIRLLSSFLIPNSIAPSSHVSALHLPLFQSYGLIVVNAAFYLLIPGVLFGEAYRRRTESRRLIPLVVLYMAGLALRIANVLVPSVIFVSAFYSYVLFGFVPVSIIAALGTPRRSSFRSSTGKRGSRHQAMSLGIIVATLLLLWFQATPMLPPSGRVTSSSDPRALSINLLSAQVYGAKYGNGPLLGELGDTNSLFTDWSLAGPPLTVLFTVPGEFFSPISTRYTGDVFYSNSIVVIVD